MPMVVAQLRADLTADLRAIFEDLDPHKTAAQKAQEIATVIADRVDAYIRTATVSTVVTTAVVATVTPPPPTNVLGAGTGTGTGSLS